MAWLLWTRDAGLMSWNKVAGFGVSGVVLGGGQGVCHIAVSSNCQSEVCRLTYL